MSNNQSRGESSEFAQYRKSGRSGNSNQPSHFSGGVVSSKGGGAAASAPSNSSSRSFNKKHNNNAQAVQPSARSPNVDLDVGTHAAHNGVSDARVTNTSSNATRPIDAPTQEITRTVPRPPSNVSNNAPTSNVSVVEPEAPKTPAKDASKSFPLQFGSISPGFMNGVQIPARTSSAPPNLDEQKKAQARQDSLKAAPAVPIPSVPKHHLPKKDSGIVDQVNTGQAPPVSKSKRETQVSAPQSVTQSQKPAVHPIPGMPVQMPFHQHQVPIQFGGPNPQIQSQAMSGTSLPLQMQMPMPMQQPMFIPSLQPHPVQSQGMMHQGQNFHFPPQMGHQLPPQLGGMGINMSPQFPQQPAGKYGGSRKSVKITHPETHEELRLDSSPIPRSHSNVPPQSQPTPFPPNHPMNFYTSTYSATPPYFPGGSTLSKNSTQVSAAPSSQPPRSYSQVTVKPPTNSNGEKKQLLSSVSVVDAKSSEATGLHGEDSVRHHNEVEQSSLSSLAQPKPALQTPSTSAAPSGSVNAESVVSNALASVSTPMVGSGLFEDKPNQPDNSGHKDQDPRHSGMHASLPSQLSEAKSVTTKSNLSKEPLSSTVTTSVTSHLTRAGAEEGKLGDTSRSLNLQGVDSRQPQPEIIGSKKQGEAVSSKNLEFGEHSHELPLEPLSLESSGNTGKIGSSDQVIPSIGSSLEPTEENLEISVADCLDDVKTSDDLVMDIHAEVSGNAESSCPVKCSSTQADISSGSDALLSVVDSTGIRETPVVKPASVDQEIAPVLKSSPNDVSKTGDENTNKSTGGLVSPSLSKVSPAVPRGKKKKDLYRKAEAAGTSSDLYMAYKGPEEKKETGTPAESMEYTSKICTKQASADISSDNNVPGEKAAVSKVEPDDWEDAAEISPQLGSSKKETEVNDRDAACFKTKKYSRDFLLKFMEQCCDLPEGFEITSDIDALMLSGPQESYPSPGRNIVRPVGGSTADRRLGGDDDKRNKYPSPLMPGRGDIRADVGYGANIVDFRPGQGGNYGVLRNPKPQTAAHYAGGLLPIQSSGQGGLPRNNADADRWQRGANFQRGLMSSPQTLPPVMHKAERKYEVGKIAGEEEAKQRQLKAILNKLTPQNFDKLFQQVKQVNIDNVVTLTGVISQIFDKALMEPTFCEMYADFCFHLAADLPELKVDNEKITFKRLLLNKCQEEFERGEREEEEANKADAEGELEQTAEEREEKRLGARRRMLGNIRLIGELYKKRMLTERIMHECIKKLLGQYQNPDEENIEAFCKLMSTIGVMIDHPKAKDHMDAYFDIMAQLSINMKLSSRVRFMLKDAIDLRKNKWQQRRKVEGPKKIEEVHRDAAQERQAQASRVSRAPSIGNSTRRGPPPMDFASRAPSVLSSPGSQMGGFRPASPQQRNYGTQDVRIDERHSYDKTVSVPLPQRPLGGDDSIKLGPQGGLMSFRGRPSTPSNHLPEMMSPADARRMGPGQNGFSSIPEQAAYGRREDLMSRQMPDLHLQERSNPYVNKLAHPQGGPPNSANNASSESTLTEEQLRDKSMATIKEYYSARDKEEVALCIKDLNAPSFHPSMISLWVSDSFERKDMERELLTKLLIDLSKSQDATITKDQLIQGFEFVLAILEDAVNDAPKAAEFLGHTLANIIIENVLPLSKIGQLIYEGGEESGSLVETGLAAEVVGSILDVIKLEKGDSVLHEILAGLNPSLDQFRPRACKKSSRIDKFV